MEELKDAVQTDSNRTHLSVVERYYTPRFILGIIISQFYEYFGSSPTPVHRFTQKHHKTPKKHIINKTTI